MKILGRGERWGFLGASVVFIDRAVPNMDNGKLEL